MTTEPYFLDSYSGMVGLIYAVFSLYFTLFLDAFSKSSKR
jgi:hypothetical protein